MKKTLLVSALALGSLCANAQKIELGLNGGALPFTATTKYHRPDKQTPGYYAGVRMSMHMGHFQIGSGVDHFGRNLESSTDNDYMSTVVHRRYNTVAPYLFLNRVVQLPNSYLYAGINVGFNVTRLTQTTELTSKVDDMAICGLGMDHAKYLGYNGGVQAGYTMRVYKSVSANVEAGARYVRMCSGGASFGESQMTFPMSVGIRYDLKMCSKMCLKKKEVNTTVAQ